MRADRNFRRREQIDQLCSAIRNHRRNQVIKILSKGIDVNNHYWGTPPLVYAASSNDPRIVQDLLDAGAEVNMAVGELANEFLYERGMTPLHAAARSGNLQIVELLMKAGADKNALCQRGCSALHYAAAVGNIQIMKLLLGLNENTNFISIRREDNTSENEAFSLEVATQINRKDKEQLTPLHFAAERGHLHVVEFLLSMGSDPHISAFGWDTGTPLHYAARAGHAQVVQALLDAGAKVDARTRSRSTPLHYAAERDFPHVVDILIKAGADIHALDIKQRTPMERAAYACRSILQAAGGGAGKTTNSVPNNEPSALKESSVSSSLYYLLILLAIIAIIIKSCLS